MLTDYSELPNTSNWFIEQDIDNQLYFVKSEKGGRLTGGFTSRKMAEQALYKHLYLNFIHSNKPSKKTK